MRSNRRHGGNAQHGGDSAMTSLLGQVLEDLRADVTTGKTVASLSAGVTSGLGLLVAQVAFATFIFSGALAPYSSQGVGLVLFGNFAACLIMALAGGYRGVIAGLSPALVIGMAVIGSTTDAAGDALFVTVSGALILSAVVTGAACLLVGRFRLANLLRFVPYPVSAFPRALRGDRGCGVAGEGGPGRRAALDSAADSPD